MNVLKILNGDQKYKIFDGKNGIFGWHTLRNIISVELFTRYRLKKWFKYRIKSINARIKNIKTQ